MADTPLDMAELSGLLTSDEHADEAGSFKTVAAGKYESTLDMRQTLTGGEDSLKSLVGRQYAKVSFPVKNTEGRKTGRVNFNISWIEKRTAKGFQDSAYSLYNQFVVALGMKGKEVPDVLQAIMEYPFVFTVTEQYKDTTPDGAVVYKDVTPANRDAIVRGAFKRYNNVTGISKVKVA